MGVGLDLARGKGIEESVLNLSQALVRASWVANAPHVTGDAIGHVGRWSTEM